MEQTRGTLQFQWRTTPDDSVTVRGITVTPVSRVLSVRLPFAEFVWNRPTAVVVERDGRVERIPILDVTRIAQLGLLALTVVIWVARVAPRRRRHRA